MCGVPHWSIAHHHCCLTWVCGSCGTLNQLVPLQKKLKAEKAKEEAAALTATYANASKPDWWDEEKWGNYADADAAVMGDMSISLIDG